MKRFVLDASVTLAPFLDDPVADLAIRVNRSLDHGSVAVVPALWRIEVANGFAIAERRGALTTAWAERCLGSLEELMTSVIEESAMSVSLRQAFSVARTFRLSTYDAVYLETARREHVPLATLNKTLLAAAFKAGVETLQ